MSDLSLKIHSMSDADFQEFKKKYLNSSGLSIDAIKEITSLFTSNDPLKKAYYLDCKESHNHNYNCFKFDSPETAIVYRLIMENAKNLDALESFVPFLANYFASRAGPIM